MDPVIPGDGGYDLGNEVRPGVELHALVLDPCLGMIHGIRHQMARNPFLGVSLRHFVITCARTDQMILHVFGNNN